MNGTLETVERKNGYLVGKDQVPLIEQYRAHLDGLTAAGYRAGTVANRKAAMKAAAMKGVTDYRARAVIDFTFRSLKTPCRERGIHKENVLSPEKVSRLRAAPKTERRRTLVQFLADTGCRVSEALTARIQDCIFHSGYVYINVLGKGAKERRVFITEKLYRAIRAAYDGKTFLFEGEHGRAISRQYAHRVIQDEAFRAGLGHSVHPHSLRHSFATNTLLLKKKSLKAVSLYLGHSSTSITADMYIHDELIPEDLFDGDGGE